MTILETDRLRLREMTADDAPFILELLNEPAFISFIRDSGVRDLEGARGYIDQGPRASYAAHGFGLWLAELKASGEPVGICGLVKRDTLPDVDLGYALLERHWGRGYAREAAAATLALARDRFGLKRILAITTPHNDPSAKVLAAIGFHPEGLIQIGDKQSRLFASEP